MRRRRDASPRFARQAGRGLLVARAGVLSLFASLGVAAADGSESATAFERCFAPLQRQLLDPAGRFSGSDMAARLAACEAAAQGEGADSVARARLLEAQSLLASKRERHEEAERYAAESLAIQARTTPLPDPARLMLNYRAAVAARELGRHPQAVAYLRHAVELFDTMPELSQDQRLGMRERIGYSLHEAGEFGPALESNRALLVDAEAHFGRDDARLLGLINNLAQNLHALGQPDEADALLERRLALARDVDDEDVVLDTLFQRGVLAFETGRYAQARDWMQQRLARAQASGDEVAIDAARVALDELERRIDAAGK
jgi:tetratricopeptide (TPR) repeat protein